MSTTVLSFPGDLRDIALVHNIGLLNDRLVFLMIGLCLVLTGTQFVTLGAVLARMPRPR